MTSRSASPSSPDFALSSQPLFTLLPPVPYNSWQIQVKDPPLHFLCPNGKFGPYASNTYLLSGTETLLLIPSPVPQYTSCAIPYDTIAEINPDRLLERGAYFFNYHLVPNNHEYYAREQKAISELMQEFFDQEAKDRNQWEDRKRLLRGVMKEVRLYGDRHESNSNGQPRYENLDITQTERWRQELGWAGSEDQIKRLRERRYFTVLHEVYHSCNRPRITDWSHDEGSWLEREPGGDSTGPKHKRLLDGVLSQLEDVELVRRDMRREATAQAKELETQNGEALTVSNSGATDISVSGGANTLKRKRGLGSLESSSGAVTILNSEGEDVDTELGGRLSKQRILTGSNGQPQRAATAPSRLNSITGSKITKSSSYVPLSPPADVVHQDQPFISSATKISTKNPKTNSPHGKYQKSNGKKGRQRQAPMDEETRAFIRAQQPEKRALERDVRNAKGHTVRSVEDHIGENSPSDMVSDLAEIFGIEKAKSMYEGSGSRTAFRKYEAKQAKAARNKAGATSKKNMTDLATKSTAVQPTSAPKSVVATTNAQGRTILIPKASQLKTKSKAKEQVRTVESSMPMIPKDGPSLTDLDVLSPENENWAPDEMGLGKPESGPRSMTTTPLASINDIGPHARVRHSNGKRKRTEDSSSGALLQEGNEDDVPRPKMRKAESYMTAKAQNPFQLAVAPFVSAVAAVWASMAPTDKDRPSTDPSLPLVTEQAASLKTATKEPPQSTVSQSDGLRRSKRATRSTEKKAGQRMGEAGCR